MIKQFQIWIKQIFWFETITEFEINLNAKYDLRQIFEIAFENQRDFGNKSESEIKSEQQFDLGSDGQSN